MPQHLTCVDLRCNTWHNEKRSHHDPQGMGRVRTLDPLQPLQAWSYVWKAPVLFPWVRGGQFVNCFKRLHYHSAVHNPKSFQ